MWLELESTHGRARHRPLFSSPSFVIGLSRNYLERNISALMLSTKPVHPTHIQKDSGSVQTSGSGPEALKVNFAVMKRFTSTARRATQTGRTTRFAAVISSPSRSNEIKLVATKVRQNESTKTCRTSKDRPLTRLKPDKRFAMSLPSGKCAASVRTTVLCDKDDIQTQKAKKCLVKVTCLARTLDERARKLPSSPFSPPKLKFT